MTKYYEVQGFYGLGNTPCIIYVYEQHNGLKWYASENSTNVNATYDSIELGCNIENLYDIDCFQADNPINDIDSLEFEVDDYLEG